MDTYYSRYHCVGFHTVLFDNRFKTCNCLIISPNLAHVGMIVQNCNVCSQYSLPLTLQGNTVHGPLIMLDQTCPVGVGAGHSFWLVLPLVVPVSSFQDEVQVTYLPGWGDHLTSRLGEGQGAGHLPVWLGEGKGHQSTWLGGSWINHPTPHTWPRWGSGQLVLGTGPPSLIWPGGVGPQVVLALTISG